MILRYFKKSASLLLLALGLLANKESTAANPEFLATQISNGQFLSLPFNINGFLIGYNQFLPQDSDEVVFQVLNPMPVTYNVNVYSVSNPDAKINLVISEINKTTGVPSSKLPVVIDSKGIAGVLSTSYTFSNQYKYKFTITISPLFGQEDCLYYYGNESSYKIEITPDARLKSKVTFLGNANDESIRISPAEISYDPESTYSEFPTATREGYRLASWYTDDTGGMQITNGMNVCIGYDKFYARWEMVNQLRIKFDGNGGILKEGTMEDFVVQNDEAKSLPINLFIRDKYHFLGWAHSPNATEIEYEDQAWYEVSGLTKNEERTLYAIWENNPVRVIFNGNGADSDVGDVADQEIPYNERVALKKNNFVREGYTFKGWARTSASTTVEFQDQVYYTGSELVGGAEEDSVTLYAVWELSTPEEDIIEGNANISFNPNGGKGSMTAQTFPLKETAILIANQFTKDCYRFDGWSLSPNGEIIYGDKAELDGKDIPNDGVITLYAVWSRVAVRISYNANGGVGSMEEQVVELDEKTNLRKNTFTKEGYVFEGWALSEEGNREYEDAEECEGRNLSNDDNLTLYAVWVEKSVVIVFDGNGATESTSMSEQKISYSQKVPLTKNTYKKDGFEFLGWAKVKDSTNIDYADGADCSGKDLIGEDKEIRITLYAQWRQTAQIDYVVITFDGNGADVGTMDKQTIKGMNWLRENTFERSDYKFLGWSRDPKAKTAEFENQEIVKYSQLSLTGAVTLYAIWEEIIVEKGLVIKFNSNGGEGEMPDQSIVPNGEVNLTENEFTRKGYIFKGWSTSPESSEILYANGAEIWAGDYKNIDILNLYAVWEKKGFKLIIARAKKIKNQYLKEFV